MRLSSICFFVVWVIFSAGADAGEAVQLSTFTHTEDPWQAAFKQNYFWGKVGVFYDSQPLARLDQEVFPFPFTSLGRDLEGGLVRVNVDGHLYRDILEPQGLGVRARFRGRTDLYFNEDKNIDLADGVDHYTWRLDAGPTWETDAFTAEVLLHVGQQFLGRRYLSTLTGVQPMVTFHLAPDWDLFGGYRFQYEWYRNLNNYARHTGFVGSRYRLGNHLFSVSVDGGRYHDEDGFDLRSYAEAGTELNWFAKWSHGIETRISVAYHFRDYDSYGFFKDHDENRFNSNVTLIKHFGEFLFVEGRWDFAFNKGNWDFNGSRNPHPNWEEYYRHVVGVSVGISL